MEHVYGILLEHVYGILLDEKFLYRSVHEVVRGVVGAHSPVGPDHLRHVGPRCAVVGARRAL